MNNLDKIYVINLKERLDRKNHILNQFNKFNIKNYEFVDAIKPSLDQVNEWCENYCIRAKNYVSDFNKYKIGCLGCLQSHLKIYKDIVKNNYKNCLILEDDCLIQNNNIDEYIKYCINTNYGLFYLGGTNSVKPTKIKNDLYKSNKTHTTHAYIISYDCAKYIEQNINNFEKEIDIYLSDIIQSKFFCYCLYPSYYIQLDGFSDIQGKNINYNM